MTRARVFSLLLLVMVIAFYAVLHNSDLIYLQKIDQQIDQKIVSPVKHFGNFLKQKFFPEKINQAQDKLSQTIDEKQDQLEEKSKKYAKEKTKSWFTHKLDTVKQALNPLKIKIQQGSDWLKERAIKVKDSVFN